MSNGSASGTSVTFASDELVQGAPDETLLDKVTLVSGQKLTRGALSPLS